MNSNRQETLVIRQTQVGARLDCYLKSVFQTVSRGALQRLIAEGHIRVDGKSVKPTHAPRAGETVEIAWPEPRPDVAEPEPIPLEVLYEDNDLLVVNKPSGMVVHPAAGHRDHTLVNAVLHHCKGRLSGIGGVARPGIVHRLDRETSGCLAIAKNDASHVELARQFAERTVRKTYLALACGQVTPPTGEVQMAIARHPSHRKRMAVVQGGREALTSYHVREQMPTAGLVETRIHTGRTHQIRVHFRYAGFPIVGDAIYGKRANQHLLETTGFQASRLMLHAWRIQFQHPCTRSKKIQIEAPPPEDFNQATHNLRSHKTNAINIDP